MTWYTLPTTLGYTRGVIAYPRVGADVYQETSPSKLAVVLLGH